MNSGIYSAGIDGFNLGARRMRKSSKEKVWVVVFAWRCVEFDVRVYKDEKSARRQETKWRKEATDYDAMTIDEVVISGKGVAKKKKIQTKKHAKKARS